MKKLILSFLALFLGLSLPSSAIITNNYIYGKEENLVVKTGFKLLNANKIPYRIVFRVDKKMIVNACAYHSDRSIVVYKGLLSYIDDESELAAILAHEIAHAVDMNQGAMRGFFTVIPMSLASKKYETKADKRAVDYLVKAGYNPISYIIAANKIFSQRRFDIFSTHPLGSRRLMNIYEHIYTKYPEYLVQNEYQNNIYYQNFLITSKENRLKLEQKIKSKANYSVNYN